jgi:hypothetical protein
MGQLLQTAGLPVEARIIASLGTHPPSGVAFHSNKPRSPITVSPKTRGLLLEQGSQSGGRGWVSDQAQHSEHGPGLASVSTGRTDDCHLTAVTRDDPRRRQESARRDASSGFGSITLSWLSDRNGSTRREKRQA